MNRTLLLQNTLYFLALINPASKIFILSTLQPTCSQRDLIRLAIRSSLAALAILLLLTFSGDFALRVIFHVQMYSMKIAGGCVLFLIGLNTVRRGRFFEDPLTGSPSDIAIVPLAAPLIAGPGTMTGAISLAPELGVLNSAICITLALLVNMIAMMFAGHIGKLLDRWRAIGPLIRITGLIVAAVAVQMTLDGGGYWMQTLWQPAN